MKDFEGKPKKSMSVIKDDENVKHFQTDDGYPGTGEMPPTNGDMDNGGAPQLPEGEMEQITDYPPPEEVKTEDD